jgi:hypothetical protein
LVTGHTRHASCFFSDNRNKIQVRPGLKLEQHCHSACLQQVLHQSLAVATIHTKIGWTVWLFHNKVPMLVDVIFFGVSFKEFLLYSVVMKQESVGFTLWSGTAKCDNWYQLSNILQ